MEHVYFNGEWDRMVPDAMTLEELEAIFHKELTEQGYDMSGDWKVLEVAHDDESWTVWYE